MSGIHGADSSAESEAANRTSFEELSSELLASSFVSGTQMAKVLAENRRLRQELEETKKELENAKRELQDKELVKKMIDEDAEVQGICFGVLVAQRRLVGGCRCTLGTGFQMSISDSWSACRSTATKT